MNTLTVIFLLFLITSIGVQFWLLTRQKKFVQTHQQTVPIAFVEKITLHDHQTAAAYTLSKTNFAQKTLIIEALILLIWTLGGLLDTLNQFWQAQPWPPLWIEVATLLSVILLSSLFDLPANLYSTFRIEAQFGFNRTTFPLFLTDLFKSFALLLLIGTPLITLILWLIGPLTELPPFWWLQVWGIWIGFSLLMMWIYPNFIAPLFNQFKPLENENLKNRIDNLLQRNGFSNQGIFVMDGSKRSGHGNAYFTGLGNHKRIVFFDTLLDTLTPEEIEAVLAHEVGHFKHQHIKKRLVLAGLITLLGLALLGWLIEQSWFYTGLGITQPSTATALILFMLIAPTFTFFLSPVMAWLSRTHEFEADTFAAQQTDGKALIQALVKLYKENANTLTPDPLYSAFYDSHPPAPVRIAHLSNISGLSETT